jgi:hypothetical protein
VAKHTRSVCRLDASEAVVQVASILSNSQLLQYRGAVDDLVMEASRRLGPSDLLTAETFVVERLGQSEFAPVLSRLDGGADTVMARLTGEIRNYRPSVRSSASDLPAFIRISLLSQIDSASWAGWLLSFPTSMYCARPSWWISRRSGRPRYFSSSTAASRRGCLPGLGTECSGRHCRHSALGRPDCVSHIRGAASYRRRQRGRSRGRRGSPATYPSTLGDQLGT